MPRPVSPADLALMRRMDELHLNYPFMGARQLRNTLVREGCRTGRAHIGTLMKRMGIEAIYRKPGTSKKHPGHQVYPYLLRNLAIRHANQVWALDTTYRQRKCGSELLNNAKKLFKQTEPVLYPEVYLGLRHIHLIARSVKIWLDYA